MVVALPTPEDLAEILACSPQVVDTAAGPMEYAEAGEGSPLLFTHGDMSAHIDLASACGLGAAKA